MGISRNFETNDGRLVARVILLAHRFNCDYTNLTVERTSGDTTFDPEARFSVGITLIGSADALRRLDAQIGKLLAYEKETV